MPSLSINYNPAIGVLIQVIVFPPGFDGVFTPQNPLKPSFYMALVDTGASCTCITSKVISDLTLNPHGKQPIAGVHGQKLTNLYQFQIGLAFPTGLPNPAGVTNTNIIRMSLTGTEFVSGGQFDVLLGRDVLCAGVFSMSFDGHALFSI